MIEQLLQADRLLAVDQIDAAAFPHAQSVSVVGVAVGQRRVWRC